jgi:hypothetical protein
MGKVHKVNSNSSCVILILYFIYKTKKSSLNIKLDKNPMFVLHDRGVSLLSGQDVDCIKDFPYQSWLAVSL